MTAHTLILGRKRVRSESCLGDWVDKGLGFADAALSQGARPTRGGRVRRRTWGGMRRVDIDAHHSLEVLRCLRNESPGAKI